MAEVEGFKIKFPIDLDPSDLEKGLTEVLSKAEKEVIDSFVKQTAAINKEAQKQVNIIRQTEKEKTAEIKHNLDKQIADIKAMPDLDSAARKEKIQAAREDAALQTKLVKDGAKLRETAIKNEADKQKKIYNDLAKNQIKAFQDANKKSLQAIKEFAKGAASELLGLDQVLASIAGGPVAMGKAFINAGKQIISTLNQWAISARESIQIQDSLKAVIKSTGAEAWTTASQLNELAGRQSQATGRSRDEIAQMQSVLLGFRSVTKDVFGDATSAIIDMSKIMGGDLRGAANMLGKALDTPIQGMSALSRVGFVFSEQQKEMVKQLENTGDHLGAQKVILDEVQATFNGAATAINPAIQAQLAYSNAVEEFKKVIGTGWAEAMSPVLQQMANLINWYTKGIDGIQQLKASQLEYARSVEFITAIDNEIDALSRQIEVIRQSAEYQRLAQELEEASINNNEVLAQQIRERIELIGAEERANLRSLQIKKESSQENINIIESEMRMLEILKSMEEGGQVGVDFSIRERNIANAYKERYETTNGIRLELDRKYEHLHLLHMDALAAQERKRLEEQQKAENQANIQRLMSAEKYREENQKALDAEIEKIYRKAELEGKSREDLSVQKQILDANVQAYENLLSAAKEFIDGTAPEEQARFARLKDEWAAYGQQAETEKRTDEERKKRLADLAKAQEDAAKKLETIYGEIQKEVDRQAELSDERHHQEQLLEIRKKSILEILGFNNKSVRDELEFEKQTRTDHAKELFDIQKADIDKNHAELLQKKEELYQAEKEKYEGNAQALADVEKRHTDEKEKLEKEYVDAVEQMELNLKVELTNINRDTNDALKKADDELLQSRLNNIQKYLDAASSIASNISTIWTNNIDYQLNEDLKANDAKIQSDEDRAREEKKIMIKAAEAKYEADLFAWVANSTMASAQAAMAVLNALANPPGPPTTIPMSIIAGVMGAMQVAAVISARPKPPRFASGGIVPGNSYSGDKVSALVNSGEVISTQKQFGNIMKGFENLANMRGSGQPEMNVQVINNASDKVTTSQSLDHDGLKIVIKQIVGDALGKGELDNALVRQRGQAAGGIIT